MSIASKLQLKEGQDVAVLRSPTGVDLDLDPARTSEDVSSAGAVLVFVTRAEDLSSSEVEAVLDLARRDGVTWVAYPKAGQLGTDLNRDSLASRLAERGVRAVRQVSVDSTWSALRFRPAD